MKHPYNLLEVGNAFEEAAIKRFKEIGFLHVAKIGQGEYINKDFRNYITKLKGNDNAKFIRFFPDLAVSGFNDCFLIDCKSSISYTNNFSYQLESHDIACLLSKINVDVLVLFLDIPEWRCGWAKDIEFFRTIPKPDNTTRGSKTPYGLLKKKSLETFDEFMGGLIKVGRV